MSPRRPSARPDAPKLTRAFAWAWKPGLAWVVFLVFCGVTALAGGASRVDSLAQLPVQLTAVALLSVALVQMTSAKAANFRGPLIFAAVCAVTVAVQLIPLPAAVWTALPGREFYTNAAVVAGIKQPARPISLAPDLTWSSLMGLLPPLAALLSYIVIGRERTARLVPMLLAFAMSGAALGIAQLGGGEGSPLRYYAVTNNDAAVGFFANRNHHAIMLAIAIPIFAYWARLGDPRNSDRRTRVPRGWIALGSVAVLLPMILLTGSRTGMLLGLLALPVSLALLFKERDIVWSRRTLAIAGASAAVLLAAVLAAIFASRALAVDRLMETDYAAEARVQMLRPAWEMVQQFFPIGAGFGTWDPLFRRFEPYEMLTVRYMNHAHSDLVELTIEGGLAGIGLLAAYLLWWIMRTMAAWRGHNVEGQRLARLGSVVTGMILLASLAEYPLRTPYFAVLFVIASMWMIRNRVQGELG